LRCGRRGLDHRVRNRWRGVGGGCYRLGGAAERFRHSPGRRRRERGGCSAVAAVSRWATVESVRGSDSAPARRTSDDEPTTGGQNRRINAPILDGKRHRRGLTFRMLTACADAARRPGPAPGRPRRP
jgi:hypothetical protein